jgi:hypothetical protein
MIPLDLEWQEAEGLTDAPPSAVVARAQEMFAARACVDCIPATVLEHLGSNSVSPWHSPGSAIVDDELIDQLQHGPLHRFADYATLTKDIPGSGAGVYTIWDDDGGLVYAGIAGRNPAGKGLASRLRSHASGRRSGDQFCVYVADHYVLPELTREQIGAIRDSRLSMDALVRKKIHTAFGFRFVAVDDYATAMQVENAIKGGRLRAGRPRLNPSRDD